jgi:epoxyqueuosine reductase
MKSIQTRRLLFLNVASDKKSLNDRIKKEANRLGFQLVGVTTPTPPPHYDVYTAWLDARRYGEMNYLASERARHRRADPLRILPECQSMLMLGVRYPAPDLVISPSEGLFGRLSSYAWGDDYHAVLIEKMKQLLSFMEKQIGDTFPYLSYTDTGAILERDLAQRAGLGWIGKNTCLISPSLGSFFFLAEILLGIELEFDEPFEFDHCGTCTRCLQACPTKCLLPDRTMDASRCISYLTIELKGAIPIDLRPLVGDWIFGCDICQQVCPWNQRFASLEGAPMFTLRKGIATPDLVEELQLTSDRFKHKFAGSAIERAKRAGYLRNVAVAIGNTADTQSSDIRAEAIERLSQAVRADPEPLVRGHAAWALGRIGGEDARHFLAAAAELETDPSVLAEINQSIH